jgi:hypothetical protein
MGVDTKNTCGRHDNFKTPRYVIEQKSKDIKYAANNRWIMQSKRVLHKERDEEDSVGRSREVRWTKIASSY